MARFYTDPTVDPKRVTACTKQAASDAADLVRCGLSPSDALEQAIAGWRFSDSERETVEMLLSNADAFRNLR